MLGLPGARAPARRRGDPCLPAPRRARGGRGHVAVVRRPAGHPRRRPGAVDRRPPGAGARGDGRRARLARAGPPRCCCAATSWRRARHRPGPELGELLAASCEEARLRGRGRGPRPGGGARPAAARESPPMIVDCAVYEQGGRRRGRARSSSEAFESCQNDERSSGSGCTSPPRRSSTPSRREFQLHELAVEDAINAHQRPKLEVYGDTIFVVLKTARYVDAKEVVEFGEILIFVGEGFVVTVRHGEALGPPRRARAGGGDPERLKRGPGRGAARDRRPGGRRLRAGDGGPAGGHRAGGERRVLPRARRAPRSASTSSSARCSSSPARRRRCVEPIDRLAEGRYDLVPRGCAEYFRDVNDHLHAGARPARGLPRPAHQRAQRQPHPGQRAPERGRAQDLRRGGDHRRADDDRRRSTA